MAVLTCLFSQASQPCLRLAEGRTVGQLRLGIWYASWHNKIRSPVRKWPPATDIGMVADRGPSGVPPTERRRALHDAPACAPTGSGAAEGFSQLPMGVPPVGVEPTLGTLLGGRPLPLGYGGWVMIPRLVRTILAQANRGRKNHPSAQIQFTAPRPRMRSVTNLPNFCIHRALSVAARRRAVGPSRLRTGRSAA